MSSVTKNSIPILTRVVVFRLLDTCILLQDDMAGYYKTAALEKIHGVEHIFRWFRKRGVQICLVSDLNKTDTLLILDRLGWSLGEGPSENELIDWVIVPTYKGSNPFLRLTELLDDLSTQQIIAVADSPELLQFAKQAAISYTIGVTYGTSSYQTLASLGCNKLIDSLLELPDYLLQEMIRFDNSQTHPMAPKPLRLRLPFF